MVFFIRSICGSKTCSAIISELTISPLLKRTLNSLFQYSTRYPPRHFFHLFFRALIPARNPRSRVTLNTYWEQEIRKRHSRRHLEGTKSQYNRIKLINSHLNIFKAHTPKLVFILDALKQGVKLLL